MDAAKKIQGTDDAWEQNGPLGNDEKYAVAASQELHAKVNESLAMQAISIRLPKSVIDVFKALAALEGIGYQPLMREALMRFADGEAKRIVLETAAQKQKIKPESKTKEKVA